MVISPPEEKTDQHRVQRKTFQLDQASTSQVAPEHTVIWSLTGHPSQQNPARLPKPQQNTCILIPDTPTVHLHSTQACVRLFKKSHTAEIMTTSMLGTSRWLLLLATHSAPILHRAPAAPQHLSVHTSEHVHGSFFFFFSRTFAVGL